MSNVYINHQQEVDKRQKTVIIVNYYYNYYR